jgi:hypothetical protein
MPETRGLTGADCCCPTSSTKRPFFLRFFSDEKIFTVDAKINSRNDSWLAQDPKDVPIVSRTKFPASIHVLGVVSSEGDVMPPHFFEKGEIVNKNVYLRVLKK